MILPCLLDHVKAAATGSHGATAFSPQFGARLASDRTRWWRIERDIRFIGDPRAADPRRQFPSIPGWGKIIPGYVQIIPGYRLRELARISLFQIIYFCDPRRLAGNFPVIFPAGRERRRSPIAGW